MATIFTKIINGELPSVKIAEDEYCYAFMDIMPLRKGHVLVVPKTEVDEFYDLDDSELSKLMLFSKKISKAMNEVFGMRIGLSIVGIEVPHTHIHLVPIETANDLNFNQDKISMSQVDLESIAKEIRANIKK